MLRNSTFNILRSPSIGGRLPYRQFSILSWSLQHKLKFEEDPTIGCWDILLIFHLPFEVVFIYSNFQFWFCPLDLSLKVEEDQTTGCWDIPHSIFWRQIPLEFWSRLLLEVIILYSNFQFWFCLLGLSLKVEEDQISSCWDIPLSIFWGLLLLEVIFVTSYFQFWFGGVKWENNATQWPYLSR